jgi:hypothetical protein
MSNIQIASGIPRSSAAQGSSEARTELCIEVLRRSTAAADEVMRRELRRSFVLRTKAGLSGGRV